MMHPDNEAPTLHWYDAAAQQKCPRCNVKLGYVEHYPHSGGWRVDGLEPRQWLYKNCPKCGYDWALWKIGVLCGEGEKLRGSC